MPIYEQITVTIQQYAVSQGIQSRPAGGLNNPDGSSKRFNKEERVATALRVYGLSVHEMVEYLIKEEYEDPKQVAKDYKMSLSTIYRCLRHEINY
jgi:hypothetical protein